MATRAEVAVLRAGTQTLDIEDVDLPDPESGQVVIRNLGSGICHSQLHEIHAPRSDTFLLGHEGCGIVEAVGTDVALLNVGDAVAISWVPRHGDGEPWRSGIRLRSGEYATTDEMVFTWATHSLVDQRYAVRIPAVAARDAAAVIGCAVLTGASAVVRAAQVLPGATVVVWGAGGVGLSAIAAARHQRASVIIATDVSEEKLALARHFGATHTVNAAVDDAVEQIHALTARDGLPPGADFVFDCVGSERTLGDALRAARRGKLGRERGGHLIVVGVPAPSVGISARDILFGQKTVTASLGVAADTAEVIPMLADWCASGELDLESLVTDRYSLHDINRAVRDLEAGTVRGRAILSFT